MLKKREFFSGIRTIATRVNYKRGSAKGLPLLFLLNDLEGKLSY